MGSNHKVILLTATTAYRYEPGTGLHESNLRGKATTGASTNSYAAATREERYPFSGYKKKGGGGMATVLYR